MRLFMSFVFAFLTTVVMGQSTVYIRADTAKFMKQNGNTTLIIENATRDSTNGVLLNYNGGRTRFQRIRAISASQFTVGGDTITIAGAAGGTRLNEILPANGTNDIDNANYGQTWRWNTLNTGGLSLTSSSTLGGANNYLLGVTRSGANASSSIISYGIKADISNTGTGSTNYAGSFIASGAGTNYGVEAIGSTGIFGVTNSSGGTGILGSVSLSNTTAVRAENTSGTGTNYGLRGSTTGGTTNYAGYFTAEGATNSYAGYFSALTGTNKYAIYTDIGKIVFRDLEHTGARFVKHNALGQLYGSDTAITLTTTGTSGAATYTPSTNTLNIPIYAGGGAVRINELLAANGTNTIDNGNYQQEWQWNTLNGNALKLSSTSTAAVDNKLFHVASSGANAADFGVVYGVYSNITNTGIGATNYGGYFRGNGAASSNIGLQSVGNGTALSNIGITSTATGGTSNNRGVYANAVALSGANNYAVDAEAGTGTNNYGVRARSITSGTNNYGVWIEASGATNNYALVTNVGRSGFGTTAPVASAIVEISSTTQGLLLPRMTKVQRDAITSPATGLMVYQTDNTPGLRVFNGTNWMRFTETAD